MSKREQFDNSAVLNELKETSGNNRIRIPSQISFDLNDKVCNIHMTADTVCENCQSDYAAFDGWALVLRAWLGCSISFSWDTLTSRTEVQERHYQRFLYRLIHLSSAVDWFTIKKGCRSLLSASEVLNHNGSNKKRPGDFVVNVPIQGRDKKIALHSRPLDKLTEEELEMLFYNKPERLFSEAGINEHSEKLRQIPIGVFEERLSNDTRVFTGGTSMIDLGAIDNNTLALFELKKPSNVRVGAISELLLYAHIMRDVQTGILGYPEDHKGKIEHRISKSNHVKAFILANRLHPLLDNRDMFKILNKTYGKRNQEFGFIRYEGKPNSIKCTRENWQSR